MKSGLVLLFVAIFLVFLRVLAIYFLWNLVVSPLFNLPSMSLLQSAIIETCCLILLNKVKVED